MSIGTYSNKNFKLLIWLIPLAVFVFMSLIGLWLLGKIVDRSEQDFKRLNTAIQIQNDEELNYSIDTKQGNILAPVVIKSVDTVKFSEMNKEFIVVERTTERYTRHETKSCDSDGNCITTVYYSWDSWGNNKVESKQIELAGRKYSTSGFRFALTGIKAKDVVPQAKGDYWYPDGETWWTSEGDIRYYYKVIHDKTKGSIFANTSSGYLTAHDSGKIEVKNETVKEVISKAESSGRLIKFFFIFFWIIITILATGILIYYILEEYTYL